MPLAASLTLIVVLTSVFIRLFRIWRFGLAIHDFDSFRTYETVRNVLGLDERTAETTVACLGPLSAVLSVILVYLFAKETTKDTVASILSATTLSIAPGFFFGTVAGTADGSCAALPAMLAAFLFYVRESKAEACAAGIILGFIVFLDEVIFAFALVTILVDALVRVAMTRRVDLRVAIVVAFALVLARPLRLAESAISGYAVLDPVKTAKDHPLLFSLPQQQPSSWSTFFVNLHFLIFACPAGLCLCAIEKHHVRRRRFLVIFGLISLYAASSTRRLFSLFTPAACVLSSLAISKVLVRVAAFRQVPNHRSRSARRTKRGRQTTSSEEKGEIAIVAFVVVGALLCFYGLHCVWVARTYYSESSVVLSGTRAGESVAFDDFRESFEWMRAHTPNESRVLSWWHVGHPIRALSQRLPLVDRHTRNRTLVASAARIFASPLSDARTRLLDLNVTHVYVVFGGRSGYRDDDMSQFHWMLRVAEVSFPSSVVRNDYLSTYGVLRVGASAPSAVFESLLYKLSYHRFGDVQTEYGQSPGYDRARKTEIGSKRFGLDGFEEVFTSKNWVVRVYRVVGDGHNAHRASSLETTT